MILTWQYRCYYEKLVILNKEIEYIFIQCVLYILNILQWQIILFGFIV